MFLTEENIKELYPRVSEVEKLTEALNNTFEQYQINNWLRIAAFLARISHECSDFTVFSEIWNNNPTQRNYDIQSGSKLSLNLGNTQVGDGMKFRGRGAVQLTGKFNYKKYSLYKKIDFVGNPDLLSSYPFNIDVAGWYWYNNNLNYFSDKGDLKTIVLRINGGLNGYEDTKIRYVKLLKWIKENGKD